MTKIASLFLAGVLSMAAADTRTFTGVITCSMCGRDHAAMKIAPTAKCVRDCIKMDKRSRYALDDGKNIYKLSDQQTPEKFAAQQVKVTGVLYEKTGIIKVDSIQPVK